MHKRHGNKGEFYHNELHLALTLAARKSHFGSVSEGPGSHSQENMSFHLRTSIRARLRAPQNMDTTLSCRLKGGWPEWSRESHRRPWDEA